jgi:hypothetical protein
MLSHPIGVYINWAAYDELSDIVELTEALAMRQLAEVARLKQCGVQIDYYVMDAFWFAPDTGYRTWRSPHWSSAGPQRWIEGCYARDVKPGLWLTANNLHQQNLFPMQLIPAWSDSFDPELSALCCFYGGFLPHFVATLAHWYDHGVRMYKIDFANFDAAPPHLKRTMLPAEIRAANQSAWRGAVKAFRQEHPDARFLGYNGFEERRIHHATDVPLQKAVDTRWLEVFDALYCGDPRPADTPAMNFWRAKDIYSDHMVRVYRFNDIPLPRIDNSAFMIGLTGTCYRRGAAAWRGMLVLSLARGGWVNTYYGNLELLTDADGRWFAAVQAAYFDLMQRTPVQTFGALPGTAQPYGYLALDGADGLITVVNPAQATMVVPLPVACPGCALIFHDAGLTPQVTATTVTLGPEQMAVIGVGSYATMDWGVEDDVTIPGHITPLPVTFEQKSPHALRATLTPPRRGRLRVVMQQFDADGRVVRTSGGAPPAGVTLAQLLRIEAYQGEQAVPVTVAYDKAIWSGLSWAVGEIDLERLAPTAPLDFVLTTADPAVHTLQGRLYHILVQA